MALCCNMCYGWHSPYHQYVGAKRYFKHHFLKDQFGTPCSVSNDSVCVFEQRHSILMTASQNARCHNRRMWECSPSHCVVFAAVFDCTNFRTSPRKRFYSRKKSRLVSKY